MISSAVSRPWRTCSTRWRPGSAYGALACAALLVATLHSGCRIHHQEFASYKEAFAQARAAGEEVLLDFDVQRREAERLETRAVPAPAQAGDAIVLRFLAWDVLARFNDALTALAEGKSREEVGSAVNAFLEALRRVPVKKVAEAAGRATPFSPAIEIVLAELERAVQYHRFREAVAKGAEIEPVYTGLLLADSANFRNVAVELERAGSLRHIDRIADHARRFRALLPERIRASLSALDLAEATTEEQRSVLERFGAAVARVTDAVDELPEAELSAVARAALEAEGRAIVEAVAAVERSDERRRLAGAVLDGYEALVRELEARMRSLHEATERGEHELPEVSELFRISTELRQALARSERLR